VLTNYHVLKLTAADDFEANARRAILRFGCLTSVRGDATKGLEFRLAPELVLERSPTEELDFALLKVEDKIKAEQAITPAPFAADLPAQKSPLNILHHPGGDTMKLSRSSNGVSGVYADAGLVQYVTPAMEGSSGSPCFNDEWKVVALHHAQRSRGWGSVREGIPHPLYREADPAATAVGPKERPMIRRVVANQNQAAQVGGGQEVDTFVDRVVKYIPTEIVSAWVAAKGVVAAAGAAANAYVLWVCFAVGVIFTVLYTSLR
jgi:hypothetical protein